MQIVFTKKIYFFLILSILFISLFIISLVYIPFGHAALFGEKEEVKQILADSASSIDGVLVLDFAWRNNLGFNHLGIDTNKINIIATYAATKPNEKGIKTITTESCSSGRLPSVFSNNCSDYTRPLQYRFIVPPKWISSNGNKLNIKLAERINGAGDYQLTGVRFDCPKSLCNNKKFKSRESGVYESNFMLGFEPREKNDEQHTLLLGQDLSASFTGQYTGTLLGLVHSKGFYGEEKHADLPNYNRPQSGGFYPALQDKTGRWHVSEMAFKTRHEGSCQSDYNGPSIHAKNYTSMRWAQAFPAATYGSVYDTYKYNENSEKVFIKPTQWTGCVSFKAENPKTSADGTEERQYAFEDGKLYKRRIQRYVNGISLDETIYLDSLGKLDTYELSEYVDKTQKETNQLWSQLELKAYPETKPAPNIDIKAILQEADDVLTIITPEFKP
jgi:hypothetical protein